MYQLIFILALSLIDGAGYLTLFVPMLALRVDIVRPGAYSIPLFAVYIYASVRLAHPDCRWRMREGVAQSRIHI